MKRNVRELSGAALDWAVATTLQLTDGRSCIISRSDLHGLVIEREAAPTADNRTAYILWRPSLDEEQAKAIMKAFRITTSSDIQWSTFSAAMSCGELKVLAKGGTRLEAAMRCFVASHRSRMEVPKSLIKSAHKSTHADSRNKHSHTLQGVITYAQAQNH